jgi:Secretion system C-terminal sorting domain
MKQFYLILISIINCTIQLHAQDAINAAGGTATGSGGSATFSIGIPIYTNYKNAALYIEEGVQHPIVLNTPLGIANINATAMCNNANVNIAWYVSDNKNVQQYIVEKSNDNLDWQLLKNIEVINNTKLEYNCIDGNPFATNTFYRVAQKMQNGEKNYSVVMHVLNCNGGNNSISIYPNPVTDGVYINTVLDKNAFYELYNAQGKLLHSDKLTSNYTLVNMMPYASGNYTLKVIKSNNAVQIFKITKQ